VFHDQEVLQVLYQLYSVHHFELLLLFQNSLAFCFLLLPYLLVLFLDGLNFLFQLVQSVLAVLEGDYCLVELLFVLAKFITTLVQQVLSLAGNVFHAPLPHLHRVGSHQFAHPI